MSKYSEFISNLYKDRNKKSLLKKHPYGYIKIDTSRFAVDYERIKLSSENFMYVKVALISKVIDEKEGNK